MSREPTPERAPDDPVTVAAYRAFVRRAEADPNVLGLVLFGSRGFDAFVTAGSDFDVFVIVGTDPTPWKTSHGSPVETWPMTIDAFREHALSDAHDAWNRPAFLGARVVLDRLDGEIGRLVERKATLTVPEARSIAATALGDYLNALYRSLANLEAGRDLAGRLDGLSALAPLLTAAFALDGRVRPFNKWIRHELAARPLSVEGLVELVEAIARDPTPPLQREAFRLIERAARAAGHDAIVDDWEPDVAWLRGESEHEGALPDG